VGDTVSVSNLREVGQKHLTIPFSDFILLPGDPASPQKLPVLHNSGSSIYIRRQPFTGNGAQLNPWKGEAIVSVILPAGINVQWITVFGRSQRGTTLTTVMGYFYRVNRAGTMEMISELEVGAGGTIGNIEFFNQSVGSAEETTSEEYRYFVRVTMYHNSSINQSPDDVAVLSVRITYQMPTYQFTY
jgi:hypothetical protein